MVDDGRVAIRDLEARLDRAEAALDASEARYRALFDHAPDAIVEVDRRGVIVEANETARRRLRELAPDVVGARLDELFAPTSARAVSSWFSDVGGSVEGEHLLADGRVVLLRAVPYRSGSGAALVALRDVSDRVALQAELADARRHATTAQVASAVAHEVNNPLTVLQLRLDLLGEEIDDRGVRSRLASLRQQVDRIEQTMAGLLVVAHGLPDASASVPVDAWLDAALRVAAPWVPAERVVIQVHESLAVRGDLPALAHALGRVIRRAAGDQGRVKVTARGQGPRVVVEVLGPGRCAAARDEVSIPEVVLRDHGGALASQPSACGGFACVLELPRAVSAASSAGPPRVLVVEDEALLREVLLEWGRRAGYRIEAVASGEAALERLASEPYDAVLTDERLPGMTGRELLTRALALRPALAGRAALMTGGVADGRWPVLRKPFSRVRLVELLGGLVGH